MEVSGEHKVIGLPDVVIKQAEWFPLTQNHGPIPEQAGRDISSEDVASRKSACGIVALRVNDSFDIRIELKVCHAVFDDGDLFLADPVHDGEVDSVPEVYDAEVIAEYRDKDNIGEVQSINDSLILSRVSVDYEEVDVIISESRFESSHDVDIREQLLRNVESVSEIELFVEVNGENA